MQVCTNVPAHITRDHYLFEGINLAAECRATLTAVPAITADLAAFATRILDVDGVIIAGGFPLSALCNAPASDVDIFLVGLSEAAAGAACQQLLHQFSVCREVYVTDNAVSFMASANGRDIKVQVRCVSCTVAHVTLLLCCDSLTHCTARAPVRTTGHSQGVSIGNGRVTFF